MDLIYSLSASPTPGGRQAGAPVLTVVILK